MKNILLIDDDGDMLAMTKRWLAKEGYEVTDFCSGIEALPFLEKNSVDLILLDYAMPVMDGPEVLSKIRSNDKTKSIPVLYRTGMDDGIKDENSADGIVPKSEGKLCLINAVRNILE